MKYKRRISFEQKDFGTGCLGRKTLIRQHLPVFPKIIKISSTDLKTDFFKFEANFSRKLLKYGKVASRAVTRTRLHRAKVPQGRERARDGGGG